MTEGVCAATLLLSAQVNPETPPVFDLFSACWFFLKKSFICSSFILHTLKKGSAVLRPLLAKIVRLGHLRCCRVF